MGGLTSGGGHGGKQRSMLLNGPACPDIPDILVLASSLPSISYRRSPQITSTRTFFGPVLVLTMSHGRAGLGLVPARTSLLPLLHAVGTIPALTGLRRMMPRCVHRGRHIGPRPSILSMRPNHPAAGYSTQGARSTPHPEAGSTSLEYGPAAEFERGNGIDLVSIARCRS